MIKVLVAKVLLKDSELSTINYVGVILTQELIESLRFRLRQSKRLMMEDENFSEISWGNCLEVFFFNELPTLITKCLDIKKVMKDCNYIVIDLPENCFQEQVDKEFIEFMVPLEWCLLVVRPSGLLWTAVTKDSSFEIDTVDIPDVCISDL